jgi:hypothetical protein
MSLQQSGAQYGSTSSKTSQKSESIRKRKHSSSCGTDGYSLTTRPRQSLFTRASKSSENLYSDATSLCKSPGDHSTTRSSNSVRNGISVRRLSLPAGVKSSIENWQLAQADEETPSTTDDSSQRGGMEPPRAPKPGWEWVWFPQGYWAEREITEPTRSPKWNKSPMWRGLSYGKKSAGTSPSNGQGTASSTPEQEVQVRQSFEVTYAKDSDETSASPPSQIVRRATGASQASSKIIQGLKYVSPTYPHFVSPTGQPEGLYCKAKRNLGVGSNSRPKEVGEEHNPDVQIFLMLL